VDVFRALCDHAVPQRTELEAKVAELHLDRRYARLAPEGPAPASLDAASRGQGSLELRGERLDRTCDLALIRTQARRVEIKRRNLTQTCTAMGTLNPGQSCTASIDFRPTATGPRTASLTITDTAPRNPHHVGLTGTGT
jgi:hypothetical protein